MTVSGEVEGDEGEGEEKRRGMSGEVKERRREGEGKKSKLS